MAALSMRPCGPGPAPPAPPAAGPLTLPCASAAARCGPGCAPRRRGRASRAQLPPALLRGARRPSASTPPPAARRRLFLPPAGCYPSSQLRRSANARLATSASARCGSGGAGNRAAPETGGGAPGARVPASLPAPSAARAGPRARDAPPRGTVPTACCSCRRNGSPPLTWVPDPDWRPRRLEQDPLSLCFRTLLALSTPRVQALAQVAPNLTTPRFSHVESGVRQEVVKWKHSCKSGNISFPGSLIPSPNTHTICLPLILFFSPRCFTHPPTPRICKCSWLFPGTVKLGVLSIYPTPLDPGGLPGGVREALCKSNSNDIVVVH